MARHISFGIAFCMLGCGAPLAADAPVRASPTSLLPVHDAYPHVARDGRVVFQSNRVGSSKLFVAQLNGSDLRQLTTASGEDVTPRQHK